MSEDVVAISARDRRRDKIYKILHETGAKRRYLAKRLFPLLERAGLHLTTDHFYEIIPNTAVVAKNYDSTARPCIGIDFHAAEGKEWLLRILRQFAPGFYEQAAKEEYYEANSYFRGADALTLYCVLRDLKPRRVIEIGHGFSTRVILTALRENSEEGSPRPSLLSVDPYARFVATSAAQAAVDFEIHGKPLQESIDLIIGELQPGDMLFVDSTHVFKYGSDVELYFDLLYAKLPAGVHIHVHDIFSPYHYPLDWMTQHKRFWNEQYYLENFLRFNDRFAVTLPLHLLVREEPEVLDAFREYLRGPEYLFLGQSIYMKRLS